jgi:hypothetical protein
VILHGGVTAAFRSADLRDAATFAEEVAKCENLAAASTIRDQEDDRVW